jgi:hypothetical protein
LKKIGLVDDNFEPVGAAHDRADLEITWRKDVINVELKTEAASVGSLALKWDGKKPKNKRWAFSDVSGDEEKQFLADLAESSGALDKLNASWTDTPAKYAREDSKDADEKLLAFSWKQAKDRESKKQVYRKELEKFKELKEKLPGSVIADYYEKKKTYYVKSQIQHFLYQYLVNELLWEINYDYSLNTLDNFNRVKENNGVYLDRFEKLLLDVEKHNSGYLVKECADIVESYKNNFANKKKRDIRNLKLSFIYNNKKNP